jgi:alkanesulfonate monooxygenase SsuD/methylene tetrahydromethanopterin reductase-like flavin-dependent oxidoreductase (luciferase family)
MAAFACEAVRRADELGFDTTLIAERFLVADLSAWVMPLAPASSAPRRSSPSVCPL